MQRNLVCFSALKDIPIQITFQNFIDKIDDNFIKMFLREAAFSIK